MKNYILTILLLSVYLASCTKETAERPVPEFNPNIEIAEGVETIYSDSAKLKYIIRTPRLEKFKENGILVERFPKGIQIELYDEYEELSSTMVAKYAEHRKSLGILLLQDSVILTNDLRDELTTIGITYNENTHTLSTDKFVRLVKAKSQDTLYGWGMEAKDDFSRMNIRNLTSKRKSESNDTP